MTIALCSTGEEHTSPVDERFGRANFFLFYDVEKKEWKSLENRAKTSKSGAGALAVQQLVDMGTEILIAPEVGPQAMDALQKFKITSYYQGDSRTPEEAFNAWREYRLKEILVPGNKGLHKV